MPAAGHSPEATPPEAKAVPEGVLPSSLFLSLAPADLILSRAEEHAQCRARGDAVASAIVAELREEIGIHERAVRAGTEIWAEFFVKFCEQKAFEYVRLLLSEQERRTSGLTSARRRPRQAQPAPKPAPTIAEAARAL
jgi:hypothetical protein